MTQENWQWIFDNWLSGNEAVFGKPWWSDPARDNPANHFDGPIPVEAVMNLFAEEVSARRVFVEDSNGELFLAENYMAQVPDGRQVVHGIHSDGFKGHQFKAWLVEGPAKLVNGNTCITNAGRLKDGAQAWVNICVPEEWKTPQGVKFRPNICASTGFDGKRKSQLKNAFQVSLCDNTLEMALSETGSLVYSIKHTSNSEFRLADAQAAFLLLEEQGEKFAAEVQQLCEWGVTESQFQDFMAKLVPLPEIKERDINARDYSTRTATIAANKREKLNQLYRADGRVEPWKGTAWGVLQMVNTYSTHEATQRNVKDHRACRNMENFLSGKIHESDMDALSLLAKVCNRELVAA